MPGGKSAFTARTPRSGRGRADFIGQAGFTYMVLVALIACMSVALGSAADYRHAQDQRERERELLFAGDQIRRALDSYYAHGPLAGCYPTRLEHLLADERGGRPTPHLRRLWPDPATGGTPWGLIKDEQGGIRGVYSTSTALPYKQTGFAPRYRSFENSATLSDWKFVHVAPPDHPGTGTHCESGIEPGSEPAGFSGQIESNERKVNTVY